MQSCLSYVNNLTIGRPRTQCKCICSCRLLIGSEPAEYYRKDIQEVKYSNVVEVQICQLKKKERNKKFIQVCPTRKLRYYKICQNKDTI